MSGSSRGTQKLFFILLITLTVGLAYGIGISRLSFYGDDWIYIYNYHIAGSGSFGLFTSWDRPCSAWIYVLTSAIFGETPLGYHLFVLFLRWVSVLLFWRVLADAFGERRSVCIAALLFAVYPGFQQQPIAVEFVMHFSSLALVLLSLRLMQMAVRQKRGRMVLLILLSLGSGLLAIFTCEYFLGTELARPVILWFALKKYRSDEKRSAVWGDLLRFGLPFLCGTVFYFIWRLFIFSFATYGPKGFLPI